MKRRTYLLFFAAAVSLCGTGCQEKEYEDIDNKEPAEEMPYFAGGNIFGADILMNELNVSIQNITPYASSKDIPNKIQKKNFRGLRFYSKANGRFAIYPENHDPNYTFWRELGSEIDAFLEENPQIENPDIDCFFYAGVREGARIYADKMLFGREPGSDLGDLMVMQPLGEGLRIAATYPDFHVVTYYRAEVNPVTFSEFYSEGRALVAKLRWGDALYVSFINLPPENYDEVTFTIEIPIVCEYLQQIINGEDYPESYYEQGLVERNENRVLRGSVKVRFDNPL
ncbi:MAG: hypothetical protein IKH59_07425 [Bacteroidaceae bacterium]|nr:hypothetical protein [Bacteroidaceae bacterium]